MKVLAFGAHPDDIEIGMGGTICKYVQSKHQVLMAIATVTKQREQRLKEAEKAAATLGAAITIMDIEPHKMVLGRELINIFDPLIAGFSPDIIYTHWNHDSHQDHITVSEAVIAASRKNSYSVYMYEQTIPGGIAPYAFRAQSFIDISGVIDTKINSIRAHKSQVDANGESWLQGILGRAAYRGYQIDKRYAEAFEVIKEIGLI